MDDNKILKQEDLEKVAGGVRLTYGEEDIVEDARGIKYRVLSVMVEYTPSARVLYKCLCIEVPNDGQPTHWKNVGDNAWLAESLIVRKW